MFLNVACNRRFFEFNLQSQLIMIGIMMKNDNEKNDAFHNAISTLRADHETNIVSDDAHNDAITTLCQLHDDVCNQLDDNTFTRRESKTSIRDDVLRNHVDDDTINDITDALCDDMYAIECQRTKRLQRDVMLYIYCFVASLIINVVSIAYIAIDTYAIDNDVHVETSHDVEIGDVHDIDTTENIVHRIVIRRERNNDDNTIDVLSSHVIIEIGDNVLTYNELE